YTVVVTGTSGTLSHATSILVGVTGAGPTARFTFAPSAPVANHSVLFDASSSSDADPNAILGARWDWGGDGRWDTPWSYSLTASHVFTTAGTYAVTLQVLDAYGLVDTTSRSVTVLRPDKIAPQVTILSPSDGAIVGPEDVTVVGTASDKVAIGAGRSRTRRAGPKRAGPKKKETVVVQPPKSRDPSILGGKGLVKR